MRWDPQLNVCRVATRSVATAGQSLSDRFTGADDSCYLLPDRVWHAVKDHCGNQVVHTQDAPNAEMPFVSLTDPALLVTNDSRNVTGSGDNPPETRCVVAIDRIGHTVSRDGPTSRNSTHDKSSL